MKIPAFKGVIAVTCTPFDKSGKVDNRAWSKHLDFLIENGVHAIMPHGTTGEYYAQTVEERKEGLKFVAEHVGRKLPLYAGTNSARPAGKNGIASSKATNTRLAKRPSRMLERPGRAFGSSSVVGMPSVSAAATAGTDA